MPSAQLPILQLLSTRLRSRGLALMAMNLSLLITALLLPIELMQAVIIPFLKSRSFDSPLLVIYIVIYFALVAWLLKPLINNLSAGLSLFLHARHFTMIEFWPSFTRLYPKAAIALLALAPGLLSGPTSPTHTSYQRLAEPLLTHSDKEIRLKAIQALSPAIPASPFKLFRPTREEKTFLAALAKATSVGPPY